MTLLHKAVVISEKPRIQGETKIQRPKTNWTQFKYFIFENIFKATFTFFYILIIPDLLNDKTEVIHKKIPLLLRAAFFNFISWKVLDLQKIGVFLGNNRGIKADLIYQHPVQKEVP